MISPKDMKIIQIDITNACPNMCSNCTRFCGHHKKTFFMDFPTFKEAVDSFDEYNGIVGIIGGEPTIHPEFEKFARYIRERRVNFKVRNFRKPPSDINNYILTHMWNTDSRIGLWSSLSNSYYRHFEIINDTFKTQLLNDHANEVCHQALLIPRKELGIPDDEWIKKRDACWIQNTWSASITPKGAFFCEVAGHLDMLFNGPGGWKIEPGWWKRSPEDFADQLHWCELCSGCLDVPKRLSTDGRDDVSPEMHKKLLEIGSPKAKKGMCVVHDLKSFSNAGYQTYTSANEYMENASNRRTSETNRHIYPKSFILVKREQIPQIGASGEVKDWILAGEDECALAGAKKMLENRVLNPGCVYLLEDDIFAFNIRSHSLRETLAKKEPLPENIWSLYPQDKIVVIDNCEEEMDARIRDLENALAQKQQELKLWQQCKDKMNRYLPVDSRRHKIVKKIYHKLLG